jgi:sec-independent protein translocase protein TatB
MFEIGFSEICMVALVALLVIGPEKLPQAARIAGFWIGKTRRIVAGVQAELKQELYIEEFRQALNQQNPDLEALHDLQAELDETAHSIHASLNAETATPVNLTKTHEPE